MEHGALSGLVVAVTGPPADAAPLARELRRSGASVVRVRTGLAGAVLGQVRPDVAVVAHDPGAAAGLARDPNLYPMATVLAVPRAEIDALGEGAWTASIGLPTARAELASAVRTAAQLRRLREELQNVQRRFERDALTDPLTGRPNRRYIARSLDALVAAARRHSRPLSVVMMDLDDFKGVNDRNGHATGDAVLRGVCDRLATRLRGEDVLGRLGGDELVVLLPETDAEAGAGLAQTLCACVAATPFVVPEGSLPVRTTAGHATLRPDDDVRSLVDRADRALYQAKRAGGGHARSADLPDRVTR